MGTRNKRFDFAANVRVLDNGDGVPDSEVAAAVVFMKSGLQIWMKNGVPYREGDEPAVVGLEGFRIWMDEDGKPHRDVGPAWIWEDGREEYFRHGVRLNDPHEGRRVGINSRQGFFRHGERLSDPCAGQRINLDGRTRQKINCEMKDFLLNCGGEQPGEYLLRVRLVAEILGVCKKRVYQMVEEGKLVAVRLGPKSMRITRESLEGFIRRLEMPETRITK